MEYLLRIWPDMIICLLFAICELASWACSTIFINSYKTGNILWQLLKEIIADEHSLQKCLSFIYKGQGLG